MSWRAHARQVIHEVLELHKGQDEKVIKAALREAYPFGQRAMHPYKIWLDEIKCQRGARTFGKKKSPENVSQTNLFA